MSPVQFLFAAGITTDNKLPLLQSLRPDAVARAVEVQDLHLVLAPIDKHEQLAAEGVVLELALHQGAEAIVGFAHVGRLCVEPDTDPGL